MLIRSRISFFLLLPVLLLAACRTTHTAQQSTKEEGNPASAENGNKVSYLFIEASTAMMNGNTRDAQNLFTEVLKLDPANHAAMYNLGRLTYDEGNFRQAADWADKAIRGDKTNFWYFALKADALERLGEYGRTAETLEEIVQRFPDNIQSFLNLAHVYMMDNKHDQALKTLSEIESRVGMSEEVAEKKFQIYLDRKDYDRALAEADKMIEASPSNSDFYHAKYEVLMQSNRRQDAVKVLEQMLEINHDDGFALFSLADQYKAMGNESKSDAYLFEAFRNPRLGLDGKLQILAGIFVVMKHDKSAEVRADSLSRILTQSHPGNGRVLGARGDYFNETGLQDSATAYFRMAVKADPTIQATWAQLLQAEADARDFNALKQDAGKALEYFPDDLYFVFYQGLGCSETEDLETAIYSFEKIKKMSFAPRDLVLQACIQLGGLYQESGNYARSDENFEKALSINPDDPLAQNNYAWFLAERGEQLDRAEELVKKALKTSPESSSYQDTYGWVLYKKGDLKDAEEWIGKALRNGGGADVLEHYGDIWEKLNDPAKAIDYWKKAKAAGGKAESLDKKIQSVQNK